MNRLFVLAVVVTLAAFPIVAHAQFDWDNDNNNSDWHSKIGSKTNWSPDEIPTDGASVTIEGFFVQLSQQHATVSTITASGGLQIGRTLTVTGSGTIGDADIIGGLIAGGSLTLKGNNGKWQAGLLSGSIQNEGTFTIQGGPPGLSRSLANSRLTNNASGTIVQRVTFPMQSTILLNQGQYLIQSGATGINGDDASEFRNVGILTAQTSSGLGLWFVNSGNVVATGSDVVLSLTDGSQWEGGQVELSHGATVALSGPSHVFTSSPNVIGNGQFQFNSPSVLLNADVQMNISGGRGAWLSGGVLTGEKSITNGGIATLSGGTIANTGGFINDAPGAASILVIDGTPLVQTKLINRAEVRHNRGSLSIAPNAEVINEKAGTYLYNSSTTNITGEGLFINRGQFIAVGAGDRPIGSLLNNNGGTIHAREGTLRLTHSGNSTGGGTFRADDGALILFEPRNSHAYSFDGDYTFEGDGEIRFNGGVFNSQSLIQSSGRSTLNVKGIANFDGFNLANGILAGGFTNTGHFRWTGGNIASVATTSTYFDNAAGGTMLVYGTAGKTLSTLLTNEGTMRFSTGLNFTGGQLVNHGEVTVTSGSFEPRNNPDNYFDNRLGAFMKEEAGTFTSNVPFNNTAGRVEVRAGPAGTTASTLALNQGGTHVDAQFRVAADAVLHLGGQHVMDKVNFHGPGTVLARDGSLILRAVGTRDGVVFEKDVRVMLNNPSAVIEADATAAVTFRGAVDWYGATLRDLLEPAGEPNAGLFNTSSDFRILTAPFHSNTHVLEGTLYNSGIIHQLNTDLQLRNGVVLNASGGEYRLAPASSEVRIVPLGAGGASRFLNDGTLRKTGAGTAGIHVPLHHEFNGASVHVDEGVLNLVAGGDNAGDVNFNVAQGASLRFAGGTHVFGGGGTSFIGAGRVQLVTGEMIIDAPSVNYSNLDLDGGTLTLRNGPLTNWTGVITWKGATIAGNDVLDNDWNLILTPGGGRLLSAKIVNHRYIDQAGPLQVTAAGSIANSQEFYSGASITGTGSFENDAGGLLQFDGGTAQSFSLTLNNLGEVRVESGTAASITGNVAQFGVLTAGTTAELTGGTWTVMPGGRLTLGTGQAITRNAATVNIEGNGVFTNFANARSRDFVNDGTMRLTGSAAAAWDRKFRNNGTVRTDPGTSMSANEFTNNGSVYVSGTLGTQSFYNLLGKTLSLINGTVSGNQLSNQGTIHSAPGANAVNTASPTFGGAVVADAGSTLVLQSSSATGLATEPGTKLSGNGGAIMIQATNGPLTLANTTLEGNAASVQVTGKGSAELIKTFVLPHLLEVSGIITNPTNTFDTTVFITYSGGLASITPQPGADVNLFLFDQQTGLRLDFENNHPSISLPAGLTDCRLVHDATNREASIRLPIGSGPRQLALAYGVITLDPAGADAVNLQGFVVNAHNAPSFDLSIFGFAPEAIAAPAPGIKPSRLLDAGKRRVLMTTSNDSHILPGGSLDLGTSNALEVAGSLTNDGTLAVGTQGRVVTSGGLVNNGKLNAAGAVTVTELSGNGETSLADSARLKANHVRQRKLHVAGNVTLNSGGGVSVLEELTFGGAPGALQGQFDLNDNDLIVRTTAAERDATLARVVDAIRAARNAAPGRWTGPGLTSSAAAANPLATLAATINPGLVTFSGEAVDANAVLVKYTYNGDANLDGRINADDYFKIDFGFLGQPQGPTYAQGDFDYDGRINADDYFLIDSAFLGQAAPLSGTGDPSLMSVTAVPEPASLAVVALGAAGLLARPIAPRHRRTLT